MPYHIFFKTEMDLKKQLMEEYLLNDFLPIEERLTTCLEFINQYDTENVVRYTYIMLFRNCVLTIIIQEFKTDRKNMRRLVNRITKELLQDKYQHVIDKQEVLGYFDIRTTDDGGTIDLIQNIFNRHFNLINDERDGSCKDIFYKEIMRRPTLI